MGRPNRGIGSAGPKRPNSTTGRDHYSTGGKKTK